MKERNEFLVLVGALVLLMLIGYAVFVIGKLEDRTGEKVVIGGDTLLIERYNARLGVYVLSNGLVYDKKFVDDEKRRAD